MQKIIKVDKKVIILFEDGSYYEGSNISEESLKQIINAKSDKEVYSIICPDYGEKLKEYSKAVELIDNVKNSKLLTIKGESVYWEEVSQLSLPTELTKVIINAELNNDSVKIETYKNFWTLMSLNPDERCRKNLFWFLQKYGMTISRSGFFVGYRNADKTNEEGVFTDHYTHSFKIKIGEMVVMDRSKCDTIQENTCSRGLHISGKGWLTRNYFGNIGLACLVNPADVVAVPPQDNYGKLRTCAYLPMTVINYDENAHVIPLDVEDGFDCSYVTKVIYEGLMGTETDSPYKIEIPEMPGINKETISSNLLDIAMKCITNRQV